MPITARDESSAIPLRIRLWISFLIGLLASAAAGAKPTYEVVHAFRNSGQPWSTLIQANDGYFYGTTFFGGAAGVGTVFRMDDAGHLTTLHSFSYADGAYPAAGLIQASDGNLYGSTTLGGTHNLGTVFRIDAAGSLVRVHSFDGEDGQEPYSQLVEATDGGLYGTTSGGGANGHGTVFRMDLGGGLVTLHDFAAASHERPFAGVIQGADGDFYGTTSSILDPLDSLGTVFKLSASGEFTTLHVFNVTDGAYPMAGLLEATDGYFYGTTFSGGEGGGTIFRIDSEGNFASLRTLSGDDLTFPVAGLIQASDGSFYGTAYGGWPTTGEPNVAGGVFRMDGSGTVTAIQRFTGPEGMGPRGAIVQAASGELFGTTCRGGSGDVGTAFKIDTGGNFHLLHQFKNEEGTRPHSAVLQASDGHLYGTTRRGGSRDRGTVFRMGLGGKITTLHSFDVFDGAYPVAPLIQATDGDFYGTTSDDTTGNMGTVFKIDLGGQLTTLHGFNGTDGRSPLAALLQAADGNFYGTTSSGGEYGGGTIFRMDKTEAFETLVNFPPNQWDEPAGPEAALIQAADGNFYGTSSARGTIFRMNALAQVEILADYQSNDPLIEASDGNLYGSSSSWSSIFRYGPSGFEAIHFFAPHWSYPCDLMQASDTHLYGTTGAGGSNDRGTVFRMDLDGNVSTLHDFNGFDGSGCSGGLIEASDGLLYGMTPGGGPLGGPRLWNDDGTGVAFRLSESVVATNQVAPTSGPATGRALSLVGGGFSASATVTVEEIPVIDSMIRDPTFLSFVTPPLSPGTLNDVSVTVPEGIGTVTATLSGAYFADFLDVPQIDPFHDSVEKLVRSGVTAGCGSGNYCPQSAVTRAQMAVFLLKSKHGATYAPPPCQSRFADVACPSLFADWVEQLAAEGITAGCGGGNYCPYSPVTRAQMAVFLLKAKHGSTFDPPDCADVFGDVPCPGLFADWIEELAAEKITAGCGGGNYCPDSPNTRAQMSAFLVKTFGM